MKVGLFVLAVLVLGGLLGCGQSDAAPEVRTDGEMTENLQALLPVAAGELAIDVELSSHRLVTGETLQVRGTVTNRTDYAVRIDSPTSARFHVQLWRDTENGWTIIRSYPEAALMVLSPWGLAPGATVAYGMVLPVEPDWPTHEALRLTVKVDGYADSSEPVVVTVFPASKDAP